MSLADPRNLLSDLIAKATKAGADQADAVAAAGTSVSHSQRLGKVESLERSESHDLGLRVIIGKKQAVVSSNDWAPDALNDLIDRAIAMARAVPDDAYCGLADRDQLTDRTDMDLDLFDPSEPSAEDLIERARAAEDAALAVEGVSNSDGASAEWSRWDIYLAASNGFVGGYKGSRHGIGVSVLAGEGTGMETDYDYSTTVHGSDLRAPEEIGRSAGERAVAKLNPRKGATKALPVVFDPRMSPSLVRHLTSAINGAAIARGTSFLKDKMDQQVMNSALTIVDDPHRRRGLASKPFDAEGLPNAPMALVRDGVLQTWILDLHTARQLNLQSTGRAARGTSAPPSPSTTNVHLEPGTVSPKELMSDIASGLYVTSLMGMGINGVTGDYSRGASGFWIENGEIAFPVNEMTIAGNLKDMFMNMSAADDLDFLHATNAPTVRIDGMTIAGQ
jgi:PmbA protein